LNETYILEGVEDTHLNFFDHLRGGDLVFNYFYLFISHGCGYLFENGNGFSHYVVDELRRFLE
jgi:hypothetical protein